MQCSLVGLCSHSSFKGPRYCLLSPFSQNLLSNTATLFSLDCNNEKKCAGPFDSSPPVKADDFDDFQAQSLALTSVSINGFENAVSDDCTARARESVRDEFGLDFDTLSPASKIRVKRIMSPDFTGTPSKAEGDPVETTFREQFDLFYDRDGMGKWRDLSHVFFEDADFERSLVIRRQRDGTCYMHSVITIVHYLCVKRTGNYDHEMLDMSTYMLKEWDRDKLKQYILWPVGGDACHFLQEISGLKDFMLVETKLPYKNHKTHEGEVLRILEMLKDRKEPALVTKFLTENDFVPKKGADATDQKLPTMATSTRTTYTCIRCLKGSNLLSPTRCSSLVVTRMRRPASCIFSSRTGGNQNTSSK
jgi:hypothetical protein